MIRRPATVLALLTGLNLVNYLDRFVLSAVLPKVQDDLQLSNFAGGSLATVFLIGYIVASPIFGLLADRYRGARKSLLSLGIAGWSLATVGSGLARGAGLLVASRALVGVGEASYATIAPTIVDEIAPPSSRGRWMAVFSAAIPVGAALGYLVGGAVEGATHDWRKAFFVAGFPGIVLAVTCLAIADTTSPPDVAASIERPSPLGAAKELLGNRLYRQTVLGMCTYAFAIDGFAFWAPKYLYARYGMEPGRASTLFGLVTVVAGLVGTGIGGAMADAINRHAKNGASLVRGNLVVCAISAGLGGPLAAAAVLCPSSSLFFVLVFPCELALFLQNGPVNVAVLRSVPAPVRASAMALSIWLRHLLGDLWSPPLIGLASDHAPMKWAMLLPPLFFVLSATLWWRGLPARTALGATAG